MSNRVKIIITGVLFFAAGISMGLSVKSLNNRTDVSHECEKIGFKYTNCEAAHNTHQVIKKHEYIVLKTKLEGLIQSKTKEGAISSASVYFRDLKFGPTMGVNENEKFIPASLLKLPIMLTYLRFAEEDPSLLHKQIQFTGTSQSQNTAQQFIPVKSIESNKLYTIDELIQYMIVYSDNTAAEVLLNYLQVLSPDRNLFSDTIIDLGIINPASPDNEVITVKSNASIFRLLYNVSFLETEEMSAKALNYLVDSKFSYGISAGIPSDIKVAHKFGERGNLPGKEKQLHDCGIVYYPDNPYLICVMTRGNDYHKLADIIKDISKMVYEEVDSRRIQ